MINVQRWRRWLYRRVVKLQSTPHSVAFGMALGVAFGSLLPPGLQLLLGIPVALLLRANALAFAAGTFVSNPVTYVPLYYFTCRVGERVLQLFGSDVNLGKQLWATLQRTFGLDFSRLMAALEPVLWCWVTGGLLIGLAASVPTYWFTRLLIIEIHKLRDFSHARRSARQQALADRCAAEDAAEPPGMPPPDEPPAPPVRPHSGRPGQGRRPPAA